MRTPPADQRPVGERVSRRGRVFEPEADPDLSLRIAELEDQLREKDEVIEELERSRERTQTKRSSDRKRADDLQAAIQVLEARVKELEQGPTERKNKTIKSQSTFSDRIAELAQHAVQQYDRVQLLDADVLPLVDMDRLFELPSLNNAAFVGCPGKDSVLNAGWFSLRPDCGHFKRLTDLLW